MEEYIHIFIENGELAPKQWRRYYRMNHGIVMEWGTSGHTGATKRPKGRKVHKWTNKQTKSIVNELVKDGWMKWPDPWKEDIQHKIKLEKENHEIAIKKAIREKKEALKKMSKRGRGGKNRLKGL